MISKETYKLACDLKNKLEASYLNKIVDANYHAAILFISESIEKSNISEDYELRFKKWLKSKHTLDLKDICPSDNLFDFNTMCILDSIIIK